jgi:hypothetical protein
MPFQSLFQPFTTPSPPTPPRPNCPNRPTPPFFNNINNPYPCLFKALMMPNPSRPLTPQKPSCHHYPLITNHYFQSLRSVPRLKKYCLSVYKSKNSFIFANPNKSKN